mgnify:CR=1 FL=1
MNSPSCKKKLKEISSEIQSSLIYDKDHNFEDVEISGDRGKYSAATYQLKNGYIYQFIVQIGQKK